MPRLKQILVAGVAVLAVFPSLALAQFSMPGQGQQRSAEQLTKVRVLADGDTIMPGETIHLAVVFDIERRWHLYWKNPGEGALPPSVNVTAPEGFTTGETRWPRPIIIESAVGDLYAYKDQVALFIPVTAPAELQDGTADFAVRIDWAVCDDQLCLFGSANRTIELPTTSSTVRTLEARRVDPIIATHRQRLARPSGEQASIERRGEQLHIAVPSHGHESVTFFPHESPGVSYGKPIVSADGEQVRLVIELEINANNFLDGPPSVGGLVALGSELDDPSYEFSMQLRK